MNTVGLVTPDTSAAVAWQVMLTPHAQMRVQQRGVDREVLDCLVAYGRREFDHCGCEIIFFDEAALALIARHEPPRLWLKSVDSRGIYAVVNADGKVVTTGHRFRRVLRDKSLSSYRPDRTRSPCRRRGQSW